MFRMVRSVVMSRGRGVLCALSAERCERMQQDVTQNDSSNTSYAAASTKKNIVISKTYKRDTTPLLHMDRSCFTSVANRRLSIHTLTNLLRDIGWPARKILETPFKRVNNTTSCLS